MTLILNFFSAILVSLRSTRSWAVRRFASYVFFDWSWSALPAFALLGGFPTHPSLYFPIFAHRSSLHAPGKEAPKPTNRQTYYNQDSSNKLKYIDSRICVSNVYWEILCRSRDRCCFFDDQSLVICRCDWWGQIFINIIIIWVSLIIERLFKIFHSK